ncbi:MAG: DUF881 domain-containing protein [Bacillota bacterium]|jgi:uncharacterized protein YlxW (UPF0749 family)
MTKKPSPPFKIKKTTWQIPIMVALLIFGFLLTAQYRTHLSFSSSLEGQNINDLSALVINLSENNSSLQTELDSLNDELNTLQEKTAAGADISTTLSAQTQQMKIITGTTDVTGPGISINITGEADLMALDLIDLVNELFITGAEVVSINDVRITTHTSLTDSVDQLGQFAIFLNGEKLLSPIIIKAIGEPTTLKTGLTFTGGIINNLNVFYNIYPTIKKEENLLIPAVSETTDLSTDEKSSS